MSHVMCQMSRVTCHVSHVMCQVSHDIVTPKLLELRTCNCETMFTTPCESRVTCNMSHDILTPELLELGTWNFETMFTTPCVSCVTCNMSHVMCHMSHVICQYNFFLIFLPEKKNIYIYYFLVFQYHLNFTIQVFRTLVCLSQSFIYDLVPRCLLCFAPRAWRRLGQYSTYFDNIFHSNWSN